MKYIPFIHKTPKKQKMYNELIPLQIELYEPTINEPKKEEPLIIIIDLF